MEMRLVPIKDFLLFSLSILSSALQAMMHQASKAFIQGQSFTGIVAIHNGAKMYILPSIFHEAWVAIVHGANISLKEAVNVVVIIGLCTE